MSLKLIRVQSIKNKVVESRAWRSPTFGDPGTPLNGLAGTRGFTSPIEEVLRGGLEGLWRVLSRGLVPASPQETREYPDSRVLLHSSS